jgi:hypothetical protein
MKNTISWIHSTFTERLPYQLIKVPRPARCDVLIVGNTQPKRKKCPLIVAFRLKDSLSKTVDELKVEIEKLKESLAEETSAKENAAHEVSPRIWKKIRD